MALTMQLSQTSAPGWRAFRATALAFALALGLAQAVPFSSAHALTLQEEEEGYPAVITGELSFGLDLIEKSSDLGEQELIVLANYVREEVERVASRVDRVENPEDQLVLNVAIMDAWPNHPTRAQTQRRSLARQSTGRGGAELAGTLTNADGLVLEDWEYSWRANRIQDSYTGVVWSDARRAIRRVGDRLREYIEEGGAEATATEE